MTNPTTIVAQISRGYIDGCYASPNPAHHAPINVEFEKVIEANRQRGYELASWQLRSIAVVQEGRICANDTIIAVFALRPEAACPEPSRN